MQCEVLALAFLLLFADWLGWQRLELRYVINPLTTVAISKLLEMIGRFIYVLARSIATALHSDINQTAGSGGYEYVRKSMHACQSVSAAYRPAEMGQRHGEIGSVHRSILMGQI